MNHSHWPVTLYVPGLMRSFKGNEGLGKICHACESQSSLGHLVNPTDGEDRGSECSLKSRVPTHLGSDSSSRFPAGKALPDLQLTKTKENAIHPFKAEPDLIKYLMRLSTNL